MSCATSTLKFVAFIFYILCFIFGALTLSASVYALVTFNLNNSIRIPCIVGIVMGSLLLLTTLIGCCGAAQDSIRLTWIFVIILLCLMCGQIALNFLQPVNFEKLANETISNAWAHEITDSSIMSAYEIQYACCGKNGPNDYIDSGLTVPASCYYQRNVTVPTNLYHDGCIKQLTVEFRTAARIEEISDWTLVGVEGATIFLACMLGISLKNMERRRLYH